jgi:hypothetical protein
MKGKPTVPLIDTIPRSFCVCGHTGDGPNSEHEDTNLESGHGPCKECMCERFTWERFAVWYDILMERRTQKT